MKYGKINTELVCVLSKENVFSTKDVLDAYYIHSIKEINLIDNDGLFKDEVLNFFKLTKDLNWDRFKYSVKGIVYHKDELLQIVNKKWDYRYKRPRVLCDMDDVLNNFLGYLLKVYNQRNGTNIKRSDIKDWDISQFVDISIFDIIKEEGFFERIPEKGKAIKTLKELIKSTKYDVYIVTACTTDTELEQKFKWFEKMLPDFDKNRIIRCKEKEIIRGDVLIDDKLDNLYRCEPYMKCVVFDMPHNRDEQRFIRIKNLSEIVPILEKWFD